MTDTDRPTARELSEIRELRSALDQRDREIAKIKAETAKISDDLTSSTRDLKSARMMLIIGDAARKMGCTPGAEVDIVSRAERAGTWDIDPKGNLRRKDANGFFGEDPYEFIRKLKSEVPPSYFQDSPLTEGIPASKAGKSMTIEGVAYTYEQMRDAFKSKEEGGNLTLSSKVYRADPTLGAKLADEVGSKAITRIKEQDARFGR